MPVMVVGADNVVGASAVEMLAARGGEVRVFLGVDDGADPEALRRKGCKVAHGHLDDEAHVETALEQVHTVLLLLGRPTDDPAAYTEHAATVVGAAIGAGCRRLVMLSDLGAAEAAGNAWLEALSEIEDLAAEAPMESVVLRAALVYGRHDPLTVSLVGGAMGHDPPGRHWPVAATDVATAAVLADAERDLDSALHVLVDVAGPAQLTTAELVAGLQGKVASAPGAPLPAHAVELVSRDIARPADALGQEASPVEDFTAA